MQIGPRLGPNIDVKLGPRSIVESDSMYPCITVADSREKLCYGWWSVSNIV